jgi:hypothetical protein
LPLLPSRRGGGGGLEGGANVHRGKAWSSLLIIVPCPTPSIDIQTEGNNGRQLIVLAQNLSNKSDSTGGFFSRDTRSYAARTCLFRPISISKGALRAPRLPFASLPLLSSEKILQNSKFGKKIR